ncbi:MAG: hypothetical protein ACK5C4_08680, partial [Pseudanabaena sp.]
MLQTIQGIYRNGKVELAEIPQDITESQVFVTFFKPQSVSLANQFMSFGMFSGSQQSTEDDFRDVEFNGDVDDALGGTGQL